MNNGTLVFGELGRLQPTVSRSGSCRPILGFQRIQHLDDGISMFRERFLCHLHVHFGAMLLQTKFCMLFEPPRGDVTFTYSAKHVRGRRWRRMIGRIAAGMFSQFSEVVS